MSVAEAARKSGFSESTVRKKLASGVWQGRKVKGKWEVVGYLSALAKRPGKKRSGYK